MGGRRRQQLATVEVMEKFIASRRAKNPGCDSYERALRYCIGKLVAAHEFLPDRVEDVEAVLASMNVGDETHYDVWLVFRRMYAWAARRLDVVDAACEIERPRRDKLRVFRTIEQVDLDRVLWVNQRRVRDYAMLLVLADCGARIGELQTLTAERVQPGYLVLEGKTGKREVPILSKTFGALSRLPHGLWEARDGGELGLDGAKRAVRRALARGGVRGGPHLLRHTFGRLYIKRGGDVFSLQRIMGHRRIETTMRYVYMDLRDVSEQHRKFSPVAGVHEGRQLSMMDEMEEVV
jgi:integrase